MPQVRFSKKVKDFILNKMACGHDIGQICEKWPDKVPHRDSIYRKSIQDPKFAESMNQAYTVLLMHRMDDMYKLASTPATQIYPDCDDWRQAEATVKRRIKQCEFLIDRMGGVLSKRFDKSTKKLELSGKLEGNNGPKIAIINYHKVEESIKKLTKS